MLFTSSCYCYKWVHLKVSLLEGTSRPSLADLLSSDSANLARGGDLTSDGGRDDVDDVADSSALLVEVTDLADLDLEHSDTWVVCLAGVDAIALVSEPCLDGWVVELLNKAVLLDRPGVRMCPRRPVERETYFALPAMEAQPAFSEVPSIEMLTW